MSTIQYPKTCSTCSDEYHILDKKCSNCHAKNDNAFYQYITEKKTMLFYIKWLIFGIFSLPSSVISVMFVIGGYLTSYAIVMFGLALSITLVLLPFLWIYYLITGEAYFILDDTFINELNKLGVENIHLTYLIEFFGIILVLILGVVLILVIIYIIAFFVSIIFQEKIKNIVNEYGHNKMIYTGLYLIPFSHSLYNYLVENEKKAIHAFYASRQANLINKDGYFDDDSKLIVYKKMSHKVKNKIKNIESSGREIKKIERVLDEIDVTLSDNEIIEFLKEKNILDYGHVMYYNQKHNRYEKEYLIKKIKNKYVNFFIYSIPWRYKGYGSKKGYYLTKSFLVNVLAYGIAISLWFGIVILYKI